MDSHTVDSRPIYESPFVEIIIVSVESGFASSNGELDPFEKPYDDGGYNPW